MEEEKRLAFCRPKVRRIATERLVRGTYNSVKQVYETALLRKNLQSPKMRGFSGMKMRLRPCWKSYGPVR